MTNLYDDSRLRANPLEQELDLEYIIQQAHVRWLRPPEIWELLRNYQKYNLKLSAVPPITPPSGSLFLFDRKVLRYFRKDGHCWRKKRDGKTVREAHERLKVGSVDALHCYYAHGEENPNFQRRSYWMLEGAYEHIVLVHYLEVTQGNRMGMPMSLWNSTAEGSPLEAKQDEHSNFTTTLQSHVLSSSPRNSEAEVNGPSDFDFVDVANSFSSKVDKSGEDLENKVSDLTVNAKSSFLEQLSDRACIEDLVMELQNSPVDWPAFMPSQNSQYNKQLSSAARTTDISKEKMQTIHLHQIQHSDIKADDRYQPNASFGIMQDLDGVHLSDGLHNPGIKVVPKPSISFSIPNFRQMHKDTLEKQAAEGMAQVGDIKYATKDELNSPSWAQLLDMCNRNASVDSLLNSQNSMLQGSTQSITLPIRTLGRPAQTGRQLSELTEKNHLSNASEEIWTKPVPKSQVWSFPRVAGTQHYVEPSTSEHSSEVHQGSNQHQWQEKISGSSGAGWLGKQLEQHEEIQEEEDSKLRLLGKNVQPFATDSLRPDKEAALSSEQEHLGPSEQDSLGRWWSEAVSGEDESTLLTGANESGSEWMTTFEEVRTNDSFKRNEQTQVEMGLSISISPIQKYSILDFSPDWGFAFEETKVLVNGRFLKSAIPSFQCQWSCMFGEIEVPAEVVNAGVLRCKAPAHAPGRVPFYVSCGERLACSEIREFEYREKSGSFAQTTTNSSEVRIIGSKQEESLLQIRLARMLVCTPEDGKPGNAQGGSLTNNTNSCEEWDSLEKMVDSAFSNTLLKEQLLQMILKEALQEWLLSKVDYDTKGACILNSQGQGLLHLVAALDYDWAISPILAAGVNINFRDIQGWTALHWAAAYGREKAVLALLAAGASAGPVTDPTPQYPDGRTPADLASVNGHGGIAAFLAEMALTSHLKLLTIKESSESELYTISADWEGENAVQNVIQKNTNEALGAKFEDQTSLRQSLCAVRNAAQTAALIRSCFRQISFRKREESLTGPVDEYGMSPLQIKDIIAARKLRKEFHGSWKKHSAAIEIQRKFRGWKGRKEFLDLRQRVILIQAHVRGHQVRKQYKKILWSVNVLEKGILRWRRKRVGLRNFHVEGLENKSDMIQQVDSDEDVDFLKEGRKQKELTVEKAVTRVASMVKSSTARAQYMRLLEGSQQTIHNTQDSASALHFEGLAEDDPDYVMSTEVALDPDIRYKHNVTKIVRQCRRADPAKHEGWRKPPEDPARDDQVRYKKLDDVLSKETYRVQKPLAMSYSDQDISFAQ